jgi:micrococcal nuclease
MYGAILAAICLCPGFGMASPVISDCAGKIMAANARLLRVERNGELILTHGGPATLEGIRLPPVRDDHAAPAIAEAAFAELSRLANEAPLTLAVTPPGTDRYGRLRAQAFGAVWLQRALLERGLARVALAPDRSDCAPDLYEAETAARLAGRGVWALPAYRVRSADYALKADTGTFQIVEGRVVQVGGGKDRTFLDFSADWRRGFSAIVVGEDRKTFRRAGFDLASLAGRRIRLRGMVETYEGRPQIALSNPAQIELLDK